MIINVASFGGRSHLLDTARELEKFGHTVRFYSYVPTSRAINFGLKKECSYSIYYWALPFLVLFKLFGFKPWTKVLYQRVMDVFLAYYMRPCDVFIGQSPMHRFSIKRIKKKYHCLTILERGNSHRYEYLKHLEMFSNDTVNAYNTKVDVDGYQYPDYISVGSEHVKDSFILNGVSSDRIFVNNYGVSLDSFCHTVLDKDNFDLIFVGQWCKRKGCDMLLELCQKYNYTLLHVGAIVDVEFPLDNQRMVHHNPVNEKQLINFYSKAKVAVLPSREEGLAMVQVQAVACGLPLVCSPFSGGRDLRRYVDHPEYIDEMHELTIEELKRCIDNALLIADSQSGARSYCSDLKNQLSWEAYGKRYNDFLMSICK